MRYDLICIGGGLAGTASAIAAAQTGKRVLLAERNEFLGGMAITGVPWRGFSESMLAQSPLAASLVQRIIALGGGLPPTEDGLFCVNPEIAKIALLNACQDAGVDLLFHCAPISAEAEEGVLKTVDIFGKAARLTLQGDYFIDATGTGDLCAVAGAEQRGKSPALAGYAAVISGVDLRQFQRVLHQAPCDVEQARTAKFYMLIADPAAAASGEKPVPHRFLASLSSMPERGRCCLQFTLPHPIDAADPEALSAAFDQASGDLLGLLSALRRRGNGLESVRLSSVSPMLCAGSSVFYAVREAAASPDSPPCLRVSSNLRNLYLAGQISQTFQPEADGFVALGNWVFQGECLGKTLSLAALPG